MDKLVLGRRVGGNALVMAAVAVTIASIQAPGAQAAEAEAAELAEVVVTGSRIVRRDYESQSPIVTVQGETFEDRSAIGIEAALNQLPQFSPAGTSQNAPGGDAATPFPSPTAAPGAPRSTCAASAPIAAWCWWTGGAYSRSTATSWWTSTPSPRRPSRAWR